MESVTGAEPRTLADGVRMNAPSATTAGIPTGASRETPPIVTVSSEVVAVNTAVYALLSPMVTTRGLFVFPSVQSENTNQRPAVAVRVT